MKLWLAAGALIGALLAAATQAPASWLASAVGDASGGRFLLAQARGSVWSGSAVPTLTGGAGSRDASALPGRLHWRLGFERWGLVLYASHACCLVGEQQLHITPGWGTLRLQWQGAAPAASAANAAAAAAPAVLGQWPATWLAGLGTPWNTLQLSGSLQLASPGLVLESNEGRWSFNGQAVLEVTSLASRVSTLETLGSYRVALNGAGPAGTPTTVQLSTREGALQLSGNGEISAGRMRFRGEARAAPGAEAALNNLLNIIGRRQGALSVISIG